MFICAWPPTGVISVHCAILCRILAASDLEDDVAAVAVARAITAKTPSVGDGGPHDPTVPDICKMIYFDWSSPLSPILRALKLSSIFEQTAKGSR